MNFTYSAVNVMPVYERRMYIDMWQKEMEEQQKEYNKARSKKR